MDERLQTISRAKVALEKAKTIPEAKTIRDQASAIAIYLKEQNYSLAIQNDAAELKLRAERKLGELIPREFPNGFKKGDNLSHDTTGPKKEVALDEVGISRDQSSRWQTVAKRDVSTFDCSAESLTDLVREWRTYAERHRIVTATK